MSRIPDGEVRRRGHAVVVGATSTLGRRLSTELASLGYELTLWGRRIDALTETARDCRALGGRVSTEVVDVADDAALLGAAAALADRGPLRAAIWAPGVFDWARADEADPKVWRQLLDVNLTAAAVFTAAIAPALVTGAPSALVFLGSGAGHQAFAGNAAYVASKHGLTGLARSTFLDLRDQGVKVSLVSPGLVAAGAGLGSPAGQERPEELLSAEDVAAAVRFVLTSGPTCCPTEVHLQPLRTP